MQADAVWAAIRWPGLEHAVLSGSSRAPRLDSLAVLVLGERPFRVSGRLTCDAGWRVRRLAVAVSGPGSPSRSRLVLRADGEGQWLDAVRHGSVPELDGCVDVDPSSTPLTNTLPICRLGLSPDMTRDVAVAYIQIPELTVSAVAQRYTCTSRDRDAACYRYESGRFRVDLRVDEHGTGPGLPGCLAAGAVRIPSNRRHE